MPAKRKRVRASRRAHVVKGNLYRLSLVFTAIAFIFFILGVITKYGTTKWTAFGVLGMLFLGAAVTAYHMHEAKKEGI